MTVKVIAPRFSGFGFLRALSRRFRIRANRLVLRNSTNSPFLSGDCFAELVDYLAFGRSGNKPISLEQLISAKSIFVRGDQLDFLLLNYGNFIKAKVIISGNSDHNFTYDSILPKTVRLFLCQNGSTYQQNGSKTLPIGLENLRLGRAGQPRFHSFTKTRKNDSKVLLPPMSPTNVIRKKLLSEAQSLPDMFDVALEFLMEREYFKLVRQYRFILCCEGNGFDTHRLWETLYQGSFPVILRTEWSITLEYLGLPILFIEDLQEINSDLLINFISKHKDFNPEECEVLWMPYWKDYINSFL